MPAAPGYELALVMSGGGARAAYQVGVLLSLAERHSELAAPILTGVSAGAINAAFLAARSGSFRERTQELAEIWRTLVTDRVFSVRGGSLARNVARTGLRLVSGGSAAAPQFRSMVDTAPLWDLLREAFQADEHGDLPGVAANLAAGRLRAIAITTACYTNGQSITWVQSAPGYAVEHWQRAHRRSEACRLQVRHVVASAALPLFFPAVEIGTRWFGDGGMRLTAPLSPAVHLGAEAILAISTRYGRTVREAEEALTNGYPPPAQILGLVFNTIFIDMLDADALTMERVNQMIAHAPASGGLRPVRLVVLRPSRDLGKLANEYEARLPRAFRFLTRGLGTRETRSNDFLSLVMFQPDYLTRLIELGKIDADARAAEIDAFLTGTGVPGG